MKIIIYAPDHMQAHRALDCAVNAIEADHQQCGYRYDDGYLVFVTRNKKSIVARVQEGM